MCETETELCSPIDARVIAIDETAYYEFPPKHAPYIRAIRGVYLYDANQHTHCCELTPSHWLIFLYHSVLLTETGDALDDKAREALLEEYEVCNNGEDLCIWISHCSTMERLAKATGDYLKYGATEISYNDESYDEQIEGLIEYFGGNPPF
jgi:hypothetical protein